jgi:hypothetical protein
MTWITRVRRNKYVWNCLLYGISPSSSVVCKILRFGDRIGSRNWCFISNPRRWNNSMKRMIPNSMHHPHNHIQLYNYVQLFFCTTEVLLPSGGTGVIGCKQKRRMQNALNFSDKQAASNKKAYPAWQNTNIVDVMIWSSVNMETVFCPIHWCPHARLRGGIITQSFHQDCG